MNKTGKASTNPSIQHGIPWATLEHHGNTLQNTGQRGQSQPNIIWGATPYTTNHAPQTTYLPALTDGGWPKAGGADTQNPQRKEPIIIQENSDIGQARLGAWINMLNMLKDVAGTVAQASGITLGGATKNIAENIAGSIGPSLDMRSLICGVTGAEQNRKPHNSPRITDNNVGEFAITGKVHPPEIKEQIIAGVRARLNALRARSNQAKEHVKNEDWQLQKAVQQVLASPEAQDEIAGAKKFTLPTIVTPHDIAEYRRTCKRIEKRRKASQNALPMPQGRETGPNLFRIGRPKRQLNPQNFMPEMGAGKGGTINIGQ